MKNTRCTAWIADFLESDPPRSKSLVMTIFGDAIVPHGGTIWLGSLIELLAPFGVNDRLLRTSVFRLAQEGWLSSQRDGRRSAYTIRPEALARFERAYRRIYAPLVVHWDGSWTLVIGPAGSIGAAERGALRKELLWAGYGLISPGIFGHPASNAEALEDILVRNEVQGKLYVCHTTELPGVSTRPLRDMVGDCWDLSEVMAGYEKFIASFQPLLTLLQEEPVFDAGAGLRHPLAADARLPPRAIARPATARRTAARTVARHASLCAGARPVPHHVCGGRGTYPGHLAARGCAGAGRRAVVLRTFRRPEHLTKRPWRRCRAWAYVRTACGPAPCPEHFSGVQE